MHRGWIRSELNRYHQHCSDPIEFRKIRNLFHERLRARGFPISFLNELFFNFENKPNNNQQQPNQQPNQLPTNPGKRQPLTLTLPFKPSFSNLNPKWLIKDLLPNENLVAAWKRGKNLKDMLTRSKL
jgi:hypothetical protein